MKKKKKRVGVELRDLMMMMTELAQSIECSTGVTIDLSDPLRSYS